MSDQTFNRKIDFYTFYFYEDQAGTVDDYIIEMCWDAIEAARPPPSLQYFREVVISPKKQLNDFFNLCNLDYSIAWSINKGNCVDNASYINVFIIFSEKTETLLTLNFGSTSFPISEYIPGSATDIGKIVF